MARSSLNFAGTGVTVTDNAGADRVDVTIPGGSPQNYTDVSATTYTVLASDAGKTLICLNAAATTITFPAEATTSLPRGTWITVIQQGAGQVTIVGEAGLTVQVRTGFSAATAGQYSEIKATKVGSVNSINVTGDLVAA